ncbi:ABC transporter permease [endosymbiont 'TC1' of Trimyema compressum]|uniref:ABC transporter permease n=1 Tax=endosymbiont 'TC1' of Trimyema compressum TaxID=243899 RepID=UPI00155E2AA3|nr:FtsX-like permease family protein [endosymbiont 'TC1' of Trimyema compressum]
MNSDSIRNTSESYRENQQVADLIFYPNLILTEDEIKEIATQYQINPIELTSMPFSELILKYNIDLKPYSEKRAAELGKEYGFNFELRKEVETAFKKEGETFNIKGIEINKNINIPYLMDGRLPETGTEITLTDLFAEANNLTVGSKIEINGVNYTVVGLAYAPNYIYPIISMKSPLYDYKTKSAAYLTEEGINTFKGDKVSFFIGHFIDGIPSTDVLKEMKNDEAFKFIALGSEIITISSVDLEIKADKVISNVFVTFLLLITAIIIVLIVRKRINGERKQIGVLKALGYSPFKIANSYLVYPIIISITGSVIGIIFGYLLYPYLLNFYRGYFNIPFVKEPLNIYYVIMVVSIPLIALVLLTYLSCIQLINKNL